MTSSALSVSSRLPLSTGHSIPVLGLGTWRSSVGVVQQAVTSALLAGYRHLDCAWTYENEAEVGAGIAAAIAATSASPAPITRSSLFVTSKVWNNQQLPDELVACCRDSLSRLGLSYLDLYLVHWPVAFARIPGNKFAENESKTDRHYADVSRQQVWRAMESLVDLGLVRSIGVSNHSLQQLRDILGHCRHAPVVNQIECHPYLNQRFLLTKMKQLNIALTAYSPLGNVARDALEASQSPLLDPTIRDIAAVKGKTPAQVILRWHLQCGHVVIPKSSSPQRLLENISIFDFDLTEEEMQRIDALGKTRRRFINPTFLPGLTKVFSETGIEKEEEEEGVEEMEVQQQTANGNGKL